MGPKNALIKCEENARRQLWETDVFEGRPKEEESVGKKISRDGGRELRESGAIEAKVGAAGHCHHNHTSLDLVVRLEQVY